MPGVASCTISFDNRTWCPNGISVSSFYPSSCTSSRQGSRPAATQPGDSPCRAGRAPNVVIRYNRAQSLTYLKLCPQDACFKSRHHNCLIHLCFELMLIKTTSSETCSQKRKQVRAACSGCRTRKIAVQLTPSMKWAFLAIL